MNYNELQNIKENATYYRYQQIGDKSHIDKVRFFEENRIAILDLEFEYRIEVWCDFSLSIFELGRYYEFIKLSDELIPIVIAENVFEIGEKNIYNELLFRKAASLYNMAEYEKATYVFSELFKIDHCTLHEKAFKQSLYKIQKAKQRNLQAASILVFIITAVIIAIELLIVVPFYTDKTSTFEMVRTSTFGIGVFLMIFQELYARYKVNRVVNGYIFP